MKSNDMIRIMLIAGAVLAMAATSQVDDWVREANRLLEAGSLDDAENRFLQAEERTTDPGLVAYNKGLLYATRGDHRRAELCFRRALGDVAIPQDRQNHAYFNLGNSLVRQAGDADVRPLQFAIDAYERCLRGLLDSGVTDSGLARDAAYNLEVAKVLWAKARARRPVEDRDPDFEEPEQRPNVPETKKEPDVDNSKQVKDNAVTEKKGELNPGKEKAAISKEEQKQSPGRGTLPVIEDKDEVQQLNPEDAQEAIRRGRLRIERERQKLREESAGGERPRANDW